MNEKQCSQMLSVAKQLLDIANNEGWSTDDRARQLAEFAILAHGEIGRLKGNNIILRGACKNTVDQLQDVIIRTAKLED